MTEVSESSRTRRILEHSQTKTKLFLEWCRTRIEPITFCYVKMCVLQRWWWWWWLFNNSLPFRSFQLQAFAHAIDTMHLYTSQQERWMVQKSASRLFEELFFWWADWKVTMTMPIMIPSVDFKLYVFHFSQTPTEPSQVKSTTLQSHFH